MVEEFYVVIDMTTPERGRGHRTFDEGYRNRLISLADETRFRQYRGMSG